MLQLLRFHLIYILYHCSDSSSDSEPYSFRGKGRKNKRYSCLPRYVFGSLLVYLFYDSCLKYCAFRDGTTSESEIGTPVKKQGHTGPHTDVASDSELTSVKL